MTPTSTVTVRIRSGKSHVFDGFPGSRTEVAEKLRGDLKSGGVILIETKWSTFLFPVGAVDSIEIENDVIKDDVG